MVAAYNSNSVEARNILSSTPREDILVETMPCIARVEVNNAFFTSLYTGAKGVIPPVMCMNGSVASFFIEDDDDRVFPCNEKEIQMMSPEPVSVEYALSPEEISSMALKGMFHDPDFEVPGQLVGNMIEIPINITYKGIYDTPCCFVEIIAPLELTTSTQDNNYYGLFETCPKSPVIDMMKNNQYDFAHFNEERHLFKTEEAMDYTPEDEVQEEGPALSEEEREDENILSAVNEKMMAESKSREERSARVDRSKVANEVLYRAKDDFDQQKAAEVMQEDNSYKLYDYSMDKPQASTITVGPTGKNRSESLYGLLRTRSAEAAAAVQAQAGIADEVGNEEFQYQDGYEQEGQAPEAEDGFIDFDNGEGSMDEGVGSEKSQKAKAAAAAKKQQLINRQVDRAQDLKAMNEGITDVAGFGAGEEQSKPAAVGGFQTGQALLSRIQTLRSKQAAAVQEQVISQPEPEDEKQAPGGGQFL